MSEEYDGQDYCENEKESIHKRIGSRRDDEWDQQTQEQKGFSSDYIEVDSTDEIALLAFKNHSANWAMVPDFDGGLIDRRLSALRAPKLECSY